jgi:hypothetical protein
MPSRVLATLALAWSLVAGASALRMALTMPPDPMQRLEAEFLELAPRLPSAGDIGYLDRYENAGDEAVVRARYAAQYALAPRVVVARTGPEFLIVAHDTERPGGDARLNGYFLVATTSAGHRLFRRLGP